MADLRSLEAFVWIAHFGGFRAAADKLHTTQPAVSQRIAQLERELGVRLFDRQPRRVTLTLKGQELLPYAERILQLRSDMLAAARDAKSMRHVRELLTRAGIPAPRIYGNSSLSTIVRMTLDRIGISGIPPVVIARELAEGRLRLVRAEREIPPLDFYAAFPVKPDSHMAEAIAAIARELSRSPA